MKQSSDNIVDKAFDFAAEKHKGQVDDDGKDFFMAHPAMVGTLLAVLVPRDNNLIAAGLLHDTLEDTDTTYEELEREFNKDIADLVNEVTQEGEKDVKGYYFPRLETQRGIMLKFADRLSNLSRLESWTPERKAHYLKRSKFWRSEV